MAIIKLSSTERRRLSAFFTCLVLAFGAWVITVLSNPQNYTVKGVLEFKNTPQKRGFHPLQSDTVDLTIKGNGWDRLFSRMNGVKKNITVDLSSLETKSSVVLSSQLDKINSKDPTLNITGFNPDVLYFDFTTRKAKRIPVNLVKSIKYNHQFFQSGDINLNPQYVIINGPASIIDKITSWNTDTLKMDSVDETVRTQVNLQRVPEGNISVYPKSIQVTLPVDEFTEKVLEIPVKLINNRDNNEVKIFPQKVKITVMTSLNKYEDTDEDLFEAVADLDLWKLHGYKTLPITISKLPEYCRVVKIEPANIDFIVKK